MMEEKEDEAESLPEETQILVNLQKIQKLTAKEPPIDAEIYGMVMLGLSPDQLINPTMSLMEGGNLLDQSVISETLHNMLEARLRPTHTKANTANKESLMLLGISSPHLLEVWKGQEVVHY